MKYNKDDDFATRVSYIQDTMYSDKADAIRPPFLTDEFCDQHKRRLFTKAPDFYPQFEEYGTSEENWYWVECELLKYVNGKRI